jgi:hypothetical protein
MPHLFNKEITHKRKHLVEFIFRAKCPVSNIRL